ncbi:hypothetical protein GCM10009665_68350 [Kitasatospora nipponensis]|uniref:DUF4303 domain-containing protein n=1 Tax=Kitasatospora nipponensis TaxID=258049 RepID=A0ABN1WWZ3_9ACTN
MDHVIAPYALSWPQVDPAAHPFDRDEAELAATTALIAALVPPAGSERALRHGFPQEVSALLAGRYGSWACGWNWTVGEGDLDGGVVTAWCCATHSVLDPASTARRAVEALLEWRDWLEELAARFAELAPPGSPGADEVVAEVEHRRRLERGAARLVTVVVERTQAESGWYGHCELVLEWFLTFAGLTPERAAAAVQNVIGGRFESWSQPDPQLVETLAAELAADPAAADPAAAGPGAPGVDPT